VRIRRSPRARGRCAGRLAAGEAIGTQLLAPTGRLTARKQWMADHLQLRGRVIIDAGAVRS
jgi:glutamate 5-kinase